MDEAHTHLNLQKLEAINQLYIKTAISSYDLRQRFGPHHVHCLGRENFERLHESNSTNLSADFLRPSSRRCNCLYSGGCGTQGTHLWREVNCHA